jgi:hypothetical protein
MSGGFFGGPGDDIPQSSDTSFVLRLPNSVADKVRAMIAANNFEGLELNIDRDREGQKKDFTGRTGHLKIGAGTPEQMSLPASLMDLPTLVEGFRTVDGKEGDYVKTCEVSQIMVVHDNAAEAFEARQRRPRAQFEDGLTPPAKKMKRVFAESKPHYIHLLKQRKNKPKKSIGRAEQHIRRFNPLLCPPHPPPEHRRRASVRAHPDILPWRYSSVLGGSHTSRLVSTTQI